MPRQIPDWIKIKTVEIYRQTNNAQEAIRLILQETGIKVSERSVFNWAGKTELQPPSGTTQVLFAPQVTINNTVTEAPPPKVMIDQEKFLKLYEAVFNQSSKVFPALQKEILKELNPKTCQNPARKDEVKNMSVVDQVKLFGTITKIQMWQFNFLMDAVVKSGLEDDIGQLEKALRGVMAGIPDTPTVELPGPPVLETSK